MNAAVISQRLSWSLKTFGVKVARLRKASNDCVGCSACAIELLQELADAREDKLCTWSDTQALNGYMDDLLALLGCGAPFSVDVSAYRHFPESYLLSDSLSLNLLLEMIAREMSGLQRVRLDVNSMAKEELPLIRFVRCLFARDESAGMDWLRDFCNTVDGFIRAEYNPIPDIFLNLHLVAGFLRDRLNCYPQARDCLQILEYVLYKKRLELTSAKVAVMLDDDFRRYFGAERKGL